MLAKMMDLKLDSQDDSEGEMDPHNEFFDPDGPDVDTNLNAKAAALGTTDPDLTADDSLGAEGFGPPGAAPYRNRVAASTNAPRSVAAPGGGPPSGPAPPPPLPPRSSQSTSAASSGALPDPAQPSNKSSSSTGLQQGRMSGGAASIVSGARDSPLSTQLSKEAADLLEDSFEEQEDVESRHLG